MRKYFRLMRVHQYTKNAFVLAPLFFGGRFLEKEALWSACCAFLVFCTAASSIYILNDLFDIEADRQHPKKALRPLAAGSIAPSNAVALMVALASFSLTFSYFIDDTLALVILAYILLNICYSKWLKHIALLDLNIIAAGFLLRLEAGSVATGQPSSVWLLLLTYLLALFLAISKRRTDVVLASEGKEVRKNIDGYNLNFIDRTMEILASVMIVCYIFYCLSPEIQQHYHSEWLLFSVVFVINGLLRYLKLAFVDGTTYSPTLILLKDRFLQVCIVGWVALLAFLIYNNTI